jgi:hypothetical protein
MLSHYAFNSIELTYAITACNMPTTSTVCAQTLPDVSFLGRLQVALTSSDIGFSDIGLTP